MTTIITIPTRELKEEQALAIKELFLDWCMFKDIGYDMDIVRKGEEPCISFIIPTNKIDAFREKYDTLEKEYYEDIC